MNHLLDVISSCHLIFFFECQGWRVELAAKLLGLCSCPSISSHANRCLPEVELWIPLHHQLTHRSKSFLRNGFTLLKKGMQRHWLNFLSLPNGLQTLMVGAKVIKPNFTYILCILNLNLRMVYTWGMIWIEFSIIHDFRVGATKEWKYFNGMEKERRSIKKS